MNTELRGLQRQDTARPARGDGEMIEGPSFPVAPKALATVLATLLAVWSYRTWDELGAASLSAGGAGFLVAVACVIAAGYWAILFSRTSIDRNSIRQQWLWSKEVRLTDITQIKLIHFPGLAWLVVPRLVVRTRGPGITIFTAGDARLLTAFRKLAYGSA